MADHEIEKIVCPQCFTALELGATFCRHCGARRDRPTAEAAREHVTEWPKPAQDLAERRGMVLLLLFVVLGPLALPVLWRSSKFSGAWKLFLTLLVLIFTVVVVWVLWYVLSMFIEALEEYEILGSG